MALDKRNFNPGALPSGIGPAIHTYTSSDDITAMEVDGYFDDLSGNMDTGDLLYVYSTDSSDGGGKLYSVTITTGDVALSTGQAIA